MDTTPIDEPRWEVVEVLGHLHGASNATMLGRLADDTLVVYKPVRGESPLWDFPLATLAIREVLTHRVSEAAGLGVVPETHWATGPYGPGSAQRYLHEDPDVDQRDLVHPAMDDRVWPIAVLDLVTNNADRKLGHLLGDETGRIWAIDNALTFHPDDKLRTVLWGFAGERLPASMHAAVAGLTDCLDALADLVGSSLGGPEADAFAARVLELARRRTHPAPPTDRPPLPWPIW